jgi:hypothetical protein
MKITVEIRDALLTEAQAVAHSRGIPLQQLIEDGLRAGIRQSGAPRARFRLKVGAFGGDRPVKELWWPEVRSIIYEGRGE